MATLHDQYTTSPRLGAFAKGCVVCLLYIAMLGQGQTIEAAEASFTYNFSPLAPAIDLNVTSGNLTDSQAGMMLLQIESTYIAASSATENTFVAESESSDSDSEDTEAAVYGQPLVSPNPIDLDEGGILGYELSKSMDMNLVFFNMRGRKIAEHFIVAGNVGARKNYNRVTLDSSLFYDDLAAGVYFFLLVHDGAVLGRGKFAVKP